ncbi:MAG TPA: GNAT family N-acetyltransferase [Mycobacteriales bacterium]|nr:GNAT family N-acetyltransferase [Mycobacteriales bacterium]
MTSGGPTASPADDVIIETARLRLVPIDYALAARILVGDLSGLVCAPGWPTPDTPDALGAFVEHGDSAAFGGWLICRGDDQTIIGDCGWRGGPDRSGDVEIGYGLAASARGLGLGTEAIGGLVSWIRTQPGVRRVIAETLADNVASRRLLERLGFSWTSDVLPHVWYALPVTALEVTRQ